MRHKIDHNQHWGLYKVSADRSLKMDGGELHVTIEGNDIVIKNSRINGFGSHTLKLKKNTGIEIGAANDSMFFSYNIVSHNFVLHTGIGPSGFNYTSGEYTGRQMRVSEKFSQRRLVCD